MAFSLSSLFTLKRCLQYFGVIAIILTIFPFIPVDHWFIRMFDFPHLQLTLLTLFALLFYFLKFDLKEVKDYVFIVALTACFIFQGIKIFPYTAFAGYEVNEASSDVEDVLSIYTANVLQNNTEVQNVIDDAHIFDADVLLFTETNAQWIQSIHKQLGKEYPYTIKVPKENTYGMFLLSKYELREQKVHYLIEDTIPSIEAKLVLPSQTTIQLYAIHPAPPTPQHNPSSVDRDAELMKIAKLSRNSNYPVVVMGDFNDVAWSETTSLFQKFSGLLDLRKGRGFFNTYNAKNWILRWPLDHIFTSPDFRVIDIQLGANTGSDHFPFYTKLSVEPKLASEQRLPSPSEDEIREAFQQIENEQEEE